MMQSLGLQRATQASLKRIRHHCNESWEVKGNAKNQIQPPITKKGALQALTVGLGEGRWSCDKWYNVSLTTPYGHAHG